jgi:hypothetical protein
LNKEKYQEESFSKRSYLTIKKNFSTFRPSLTYNVFTKQFNVWKPRITGANKMATKRIRSGKKIFRKTFTYFIPAPPHRKSGYREIEFDKIMQGICATGFEIESLQAQATGGDGGGLFVLALLKTDSKKVYELDLKQDMHDKFKLSHSHSSPDIILDEEEDV